MVKAVFGMVVMKSENRYYCVQEQYDDEWVMFCEELYNTNSLTISYELIYDVAKIFGEGYPQSTMVINPIKEWFLNKVGLRGECGIFVSTPAHYRGQHDELEPIC